MRLNKKIRHDIAFAAINSTFKERRADLKEKWSEFADDVYSFFVGENEQVINGLPEGFFALTSRITAVFSEEGRYGKELKLSEQKRVPAVLDKYQGASGLIRITDKKIIKRLTTLKKMEDKLSKDETDLSRSVNGILNSVHSINRLQEIWPESTQYISAEVKQKEYLPAVVADDINGMIKKMRKAA